LSATIDEFGPFELDAPRRRRRRPLGTPWACALLPRLALAHCLLRPS
jgi:hypothetical protein